MDSMVQKVLLVELHLIREAQARMVTLIKNTPDYNHTLGMVWLTCCSKQQNTALPKDLIKIL
ncbi:hypothetical protein T01_13162 [Trichinella spiralis]|uniref:Uncharacterized protein n=1 Tax=Trichinella spiralis TaxID=6334 RepID=A0A0V1BZC3_TRISP|nr:hypothetical protein T01_13162 [Trichinella spiralis]